MREDLRIGPVQVLDDDDGRAASAGVRGDRRRDRALAAIARGVVHRLVKRAPFADLRQIEDIIEEDELLLRDRPLVDQVFGAARISSDGDAGERSRRLWSRLRIGSCPLPAPKSSTRLRWARNPRASAKDRICSTSLVLPMPASPRT